jgi:hypothetical protein
MGKEGKKLLSLIHVPKTAGSYIRGLFSETDKFYDTRIHGFHGINPKVCKESHLFLKYNEKSDYTKTPKYNNSDFFAVVRNPFDMLLSYYSHSRTAQQNKKGAYRGWMACNSIHRFKTFEEFIKAYCNPKFKWHMPIMKEFLFSQLFTQTGNCVPKYIIRYERLQEGLDFLIKEYRINYSDRKRKNISNKSLKELDYKKVYTDNMKNLVAKKCAVELEMFNYNFDGPKDDLVFINPSVLKYKWKGKY